MPHEHRTRRGTQWIGAADQRTAGSLLWIYLLYFAVPALGLYLQGEVIAYGQRQPAPQLLVDVNQAGAAELSLLPGIGPGLASRIIQRRDETPFQYVEQLREIQGIGPKTLDRLRGIVRCGASHQGGTTQ